MTSNKDISTVYIDESGDLGINKGTQWFIISGAIISKEDENNCLKTFRSIQNQLNIKKIHLREIREFNKRAFVVKKTSLENFTFVNVVIDTQTADFWGHVDGNQWNRVDGKLVPQRRQFGTKKIENSAIIRG